MASCPKCGAANADGATACVACGSLLPPMPTAATPGAPAGWGAPAMARTRPTGVTILAVLDYIAAGGLALVALMMFAGGAFMGAAFSEAMGMGAGMFAALGAVLGVFLLLLAALYGVAGWGMWTGKSWAWVLSLVLTGLGVLNSLSSLVQGDWSSIIGLAIAGFLIWYLLQPGVKAWFGRA